MDQYGRRAIDPLIAAMQQGNVSPATAQQAVPGAFNNNFAAFLGGGARPPRAPIQMGAPQQQLLPPPQAPMMPQAPPMPQMAQQMPQPGMMGGMPGLPGMMPGGSPGMPGQVGMPGQPMPPGASPMQPPGMFGMLPPMQMQPPMAPPKPVAGPQPRLKERPGFGKMMAMIARAQASGKPAEQYNMGRMLGATLADGNKPRR